jgi:hypothetical protein
MNTKSQGEQRFWESYDLWKETHQEYNITKDLLRVNWKSDKYRGMEYSHAKLTPVMMNSLKVLLTGKGKKPQSRTIESLRWRQLVDSHAQLTDHGRVLALAQLSLKQQCWFLNLPLENWLTKTLYYPENTVLRMVTEQGLQAHFIENTFSLFVDYLMGDALFTVAERLGKRVYTLNLPYDPELFFWVKRDLEKYLDRLDTNHCQNNFGICAPFLQTLMIDETPSQLFRLFNEMFIALGIEKVKELLRMCFANLLAYHYRGWPDLFVAGKNGAYCIEVKTTDKLHLSQLITIPDLISFVGLPVKVIQLSLSK